MKQKKMIDVFSLVVAFTVALAMAFVSCDNNTTSGNYDSALNGTWDYTSGGVVSYLGITFTFRNGNYTYTYGGENDMRGTYTTSGNILRITTTASYLGFDSSLPYYTPGWHSKNQYAELMRQLGMDDAQIDALLNSSGFNGINYTYSISGDLLTVDGTPGYYDGTYKKR